MVKIVKLSDNEEKSKITSSILRKLPEWFGLEDGILEYTNKVKDNDFYVAYHQDNPIGVISIKSNNVYTSEIYVMAILKEHQGKGIGRQLIEAIQEELRKNSVKFIMVKTLGESHPDINYKHTRLFYCKMGFYPLEEIIQI